MRRKRSSIKLLSGQKYRFPFLLWFPFEEKCLSPFQRIYCVTIGWWDGVDSLCAIRYYHYCHYYCSTILLRRIESSSKNQLSRWFLTLSPLDDWIIRPFLSVSICQFGSDYCTKNRPIIDCWCIIMIISFSFFFVSFLPMYLLLLYIRFVVFALRFWPR